MSDVKISALTAVTSPSATDVIPIVSSSTTKKLALNNINTVGTITTGIWNGTAIGLAYGGTNANLTAVTGGMVYSTASALAITAAADMFWDSTNKRLGIGTASPSDVLEIQKAISGAFEVRLSQIRSGPANSSPDGDGTYLAFYQRNTSLQKNSAIGGVTDTGTIDGGRLEFYTKPAGSAIVERMRMTSVGNLKIAGTAARATTEGTNHLDIFDGTAPVGTLANGISLYSTSGELRVMDAAGNATLLSPHEKGTNYWIYDSVDTITGKRLKIDMERMMKTINEKFGWDFVHEYVIHS